MKKWCRSMAPLPPRIQRLPRLWRSPPATQSHWCATPVTVGGRKVRLTRAHRLAAARRFLSPSRENRRASPPLPPTHQRPSQRLAPSNLSTAGQTPAPPSAWWCRRRAWCRQLPGSAAGRRPRGAGRRRRLVGRPCGVRQCVRLVRVGETWPEKTRRSGPPTHVNGKSERGLCVVKATFLFLLSGHSTAFLATLSCVCGCETTPSLS